MCGRFQLFDEKDLQELNRIIREVQVNSDKYAAYNTAAVSPGSVTPVIRGAGRELEAMKWGFPAWSGKGIVFNARSETAAQKSMFAKPLSENRCVIPSVGFYEWQKTEDKKIKNKFFFTMPNNPMLYMAGVYNTFKNDGGVFLAFTIFTRAANSCMLDIHERMPVILTHDEIDVYLRDNKFSDSVFERDNIVLNRRQLTGA